MCTAFYHSSPFPLPAFTLSQFQFCSLKHLFKPLQVFFSSSQKDIHLKAWTENDEASISAPCKNLLQLAMFSSFYPHDALWCERSLWTFWVTCPGSAPSYLLVPLSPSLWGHDKKLRCPCLCSAAQQQLKLRCVIKGIISGRFLPSLPKGKVHSYQKRHFQVEGTTHSIEIRQFYLWVCSSGFRWYLDDICRGTQWLFSEHSRTPK